MAIITARDPTTGKQVSYPATITGRIDGYIPGGGGGGGGGGSGNWSDIQGKPFATLDNNTLTSVDGVLQVRTVNVAEADNTKPISSAGVHVIVGNIDVLLSQI